MNEVIVLEATWNGATPEQRAVMLQRSGQSANNLFMVRKTWKQLPRDVQKALKKQGA